MACDESSRRAASAIILTRRHQQQSYSASVPTMRFDTACVSRSRSRCSDTSYEQGKDRVANCLAKWSYAEVCKVLESLVSRCSLNQVEFMWTTLQSLPHRDFLHHVSSHHPDLRLLPLSNPGSRRLKERLKRSQRPENLKLYRTSSAVVFSKVTSIRMQHCLHSSQQHISTMGESSANNYSGTVMLPQARPSTAPSPRLSRGRSRQRRRAPHCPSSRIPSPPRRHMLHSAPSLCFKSQSARDLEKTDDRNDVSDLLVWFSNLTKGAVTDTDYTITLLYNNTDWQQQDTLQHIVWSLNELELYFLAVLLTTHRYQDFISNLPEHLAIKILTYIPGKTILQTCQVSRQWNIRCSSEHLWKLKCQQIPLGLPARKGLLWKDLYIADLKLKRNWKKGLCRQTVLAGHSHRVLSVRLKEDEDIAATGSADCTIRIWNIQTGDLINILFGHTKGVWCLCFFGNNMLVSGSSDCNVRVWNFRTGICHRQLEGHTGAVWSIQQKSDLLLTGSHDNIAILWSARHCRYHRKLKGHTGAVFGVDMDDNAQFAFTASGDKTVRIWETQRGRCIQEISINRVNSVTALHWSDGLLCCCAGTIVTVWNVSTGEIMGQLQGHKIRVESMHIDGGGSNAGTVVSTGRDRTIKFWNIHSGRCFKTLTGHSDTINSLHRTSTHLITGSDDRTAKIWNFKP